MLESLGIQGGFKEGGQTEGQGGYRQSTKGSWLDTTIDSTGQSLVRMAPWSRDLRGMVSSMVLLLDLGVREARICTLWCL